MFLSKAEWDFLTSNRQFDDDCSYTTTSRLVKKINQFANQELSLLIEKGYLTQFCKLTDNRKMWQGEGSSLVRIPPQASGDTLEISNKNESEDMIKKKEVVDRVRFERTVPAMSRRS